MSEHCESGVTRVLTDRAPAPGGHYVQATVCGGTVYVSGQLPVAPDGTHRPEAPFDAQARQALDNLFAILEAAGSSPDRLLKLTAYIVGMERWPQFNALFAERLGEIRPARTVVPVPELHYGYLVEIDAIAAVDPR